MDRWRQTLTCLCLAMISCAACLLWIDAQASNEGNLTALDPEPIATPKSASVSPPASADRPSQSPADTGPVRPPVFANDPVREAVHPNPTTPRIDSASAPEFITPPIDTQIPVSALTHGETAIDSSHRTQFIELAGDASNGAIGLASMNNERPFTSVLEASHASPVPPANPVISIPARTTKALPPTVSESVAQRVQYGQSLARRGAFHSARTEFVQALGDIARALDGLEFGQGRTHALSQALTALQESQDFMVARDSAIGVRNVAEIAAGHATAGHVERLEGSHPHALAFHRYVVYALEQLRLASGTSPQAADVFHSLGKLIMLMADHGEANSQTAPAQAMAMHQLAIECNPDHFRSANELAVLLAYHGEWERAKQMLLRSLRMEPQPEVWHNLAQIHKQLGEHELAQRARYEQQLLLSQLNESKHGATEQWVSTEQFRSNALDDSAGEAPRAKLRGENPRADVAGGSSFSWPQRQR